MPGPPYPIPNAQAPVAYIGVDNVTGAAGVGGNIASYTPYGTAGTFTQATQRTSPGGILYGFSVVTSGMAVSAYDVVVTGTTTTTNTLIPTTTSTAAGQAITATPGSSLGVRFLGNLVYVITGTGLLNSLWD